MALNLFNHWCHSPQRNREGPQKEKKNAGRAFGEHVDLGVSWGGGWRSRRDPWAWKTNSTSDFLTFGRRITGRCILLVHGDQVQLYKYKQKHNGNKRCRKQPSFSWDVAKIFCSLLCSSVLCCVTETNAGLKYVSEDSVLIKDCVTPELEVDQQQPQFLDSEGWWRVVGTGGCLVVSLIDLVGVSWCPDPLHIQVPQLLEVLSHPESSSAHVGHPWHQE